MSTAKKLIEGETPEGPSTPKVTFAREFSGIVVRVYPGGSYGRTKLAAANAAATQVQEALRSIGANPGEAVISSNFNGIALTFSLNYRQADPALQEMAGKLKELGYKESRQQ